MRRYLAEFLGDPRVVGLPRFVWLPLLHGLILPTRSKKSAEKYRLVWTAEGSPLAVHTARQAKLLADLTGARVEYAMRYGSPSIREVLGKIEKPVVIPLYPQYSASTTESVFDVLPKGCAAVREFHQHPGYLRALERAVQAHWAEHGRAEKLVLSFHGLPQRAVDRGDPYEEQCRETARLLTGRLGLKAADFLVTFQSRFGAARWLQPYTQPTLVELARAGLRRVDVICPGFVSDCLETLEEINITAREAFLAAGGEAFRYIPCLNESPEWITALADLVERVSARTGP